MFLTVDRVKSQEDWKAIREICALTGKQGEPVETEHRESFSERWIGPYEKFCPEWAYVVRENGKIGGYLVAAPDSRTVTQENYFETSIVEVLERDFPAHLHMNFLPEFRGKGSGAALVRRLEEDLRTHGVQGVHCICGEAPRGFYEKCSFKVIGKVLVRGVIPIYAMGKKLRG